MIRLVDNAPAETAQPRFQAITVCTNTSSCYSCEIESRGEYPEIDTHDDIPGIWDRKADIPVTLPPGVITWANQDALVAALEAYMKAAEAMTR
ncbi:hypothetical protein [Brevibacterium samyangense]|uniref:Uncharacterized protein n=1 Tax=Brevibacterium samyangense TaxID=366888 RepID=A0ABN2TNE9_9MICO